jgi:hypothetical protein
MNQGLSTVDIGRFVLDEKSFLGQTLKHGIDYGLLPENAHEALRMYLQMHTMAFGQKNRAGIAIGREELEQGLFQATVCLDSGLVDRSDGDANRAAELLSTGDFEGLRKRGWELSFFRLEEMQREAELFPKRRESGFLQEYTEPVRRWAHTAPETWVCDDPEDEDGPTIADPSEAYVAYLDLSLRIGLLKALPSDALKMYGAAAGGRGPFTDLLRNLVLSLSLGLDTLVPSTEDVVVFTEAPFSSGVDASTVVSQIESQIDSDAESSARERFAAEVRDEVKEMVEMSSDLVVEQFVTRPV